MLELTLWNKFIPVAEISVLPERRALRPKEAAHAAPTRLASPALAARLLACRPALQAAALRLLRNRYDADDAVQDTLERGLRRVGELPASANLQGWLLTIMRNLSVDRLRRQQRLGVHVPISSDHELAAVPAASEPSWVQITPIQIRQAVKRLRVDLRDVYEMHAYGGKSYKEIASVLEIPISTVGTRMHRARRRLRVLLSASPADSQSWEQLQAA